MKYIILFLISLNLFGYNHKLDCAKQPIACQIVRAYKQASIIYETKTDITDKQALTLARKIQKVTKKYHLPANIFTAIGFQESKYTPDLNNSTMGYRKPSSIEKDFLYTQCMDEQDSLPYTEEHKKAQNTCEIRSRKSIFDRVYTDLGVMQIYQATIRNDKYNFDPDRLMSDLDYALDCGAIVLKDFKKSYGSKELDWYTRYNSSDTQKRLEYKNKINRWL